MFLFLGRYDKPMKYSYGEFDGFGFMTPDDLYPQPKLVEFILQYGDMALDALDNIEEEDKQQWIEQMIEAGLFERDEQGQLRLTPRMVRGIEHQSLLEIFAGMKRGTREGHSTAELGSSGERSDGTKPYQFGDPVSDLDLAATMRNALHRTLAHLSPPSSAQLSCQEGATAPKMGNVLPLQINAKDFELHNTDGQSDAATCILIDLSGSMMRNGRFYQAKRVALGMASMIRNRFPQDTIDFVGFYSMATRITEAELPLIMPKPVTVHDYEVRLRIPLDQAMADPTKIPQHFTNLHMGLRLARQILTKRGAANKQIFIITDGQPTAHIEPNAAGPGAGEMLYLLYPPSEVTSTVTLKEALRCWQQDIRIASFALIEDYWGMDWVGFIDQMTRLVRGVAFYCSGEDLGSTVIESYLSGKRRKKSVQ